MLGHNKDLTAMNDAVEPIPYELFLYTHSSVSEHGEKVPVFKKAADFAVRYEELLEDANRQIAGSEGEGASCETPPVDPNKFSYAAAEGKSNKQRVYGVGDCAYEYYPDNFSSSCTSRNNSACSNEETYERMRSQLRQEMRQELRQEMRQELLQEVRDEIRRVMQDGWTPSDSDADRLDTSEDCSVERVSP